MIAELEAALVARLQAALPGVRVEAYPDNPVNFRPTHPVATVLVVFREDAFDSPRPTDITAQRCTLTFEVVFLVRDLRSHAGAYALMEKALAALMGWQGPSVERVYALRRTFQGQGDGLWQYALSVAVVGQAVQFPPAPPIPGPDDLLFT